MLEKVNTMQKACAEVSHKGACICFLVVMTSTVISLEEHAEVCTVNVICSCVLTLTLSLTLSLLLSHPCHRTQLLQAVVSQAPRLPVPLLGHEKKLKV